MLNILEEFYYGNLNPNEQLKVRDPEYKECAEYALKNQTELFSKINDEEKAIFEKFMQNHDTVRTKEVIQAFINGYKIGSLMAMEVLIDKESLYEWE